MSLFKSRAENDKDAHAHLIEAIFKADHALDLDGFMALLAADVSLRIGSQPPLEGRAAVSQAIGGLFAGMRSGIEHHLHETWHSDHSVIYEAVATFHLKDGRDVTVPYMNALRLNDQGLVRDYRIYIDLAALRG